MVRGQVQALYLDVSRFLRGEGAMPTNETRLLVRALFVFGDVHYNAAGNALVADAVIQELDGSAADESSAARLVHVRRQAGRRSRPDQES